jgi:hypothetical protein
MMESFQKLPRIKSLPSFSIYRNLRFSIYRNLRLKETGLNAVGRTVEGNLTGAYSIAIFKGGRFGLHSRTGKIGP